LAFKFEFSRWVFTIEHELSSISKFSFLFDKLFKLRKRERQVEFSHLLGGFAGGFPFMVDSNAPQMVQHGRC